MTEQFNISEITFNDMPKALEYLVSKVERLESLLAKHQKAPATESENKWMDIDELCDYLPDKPSKSTIYVWVAERGIPYHKMSKKLSFLKSEIDAWIIKSGHATAE